MIRLSMDTRFRLGTGLSVAIVFFFGFFSVYHLHFLDNEIQVDFKNDTNLLKITEEASNSLHELRTEFLKGCQIDEENRFGKAFVKLNALQRLLNQHSADFENFQASSTSILSALKTVGAEMKILEKNKVLISPDFIKVSSLLQEFRGSLMDFRSREMRILNLKRNRVSEINQKFQSRMAIVTIVTIVATVFLLMFFSHQIALPMRRIKDLIRSIQNGNYSISARSFTNDEVGQLITSLSAMAAHIETRDQLKMEKNWS